MKKALALILSLVMVLCLLPMVVSADTVTATAVDPATLVDGDQIVIVNAASSKVMGNTYNTQYSQYNSIGVTVAEGQIEVPEGAMVLTFEETETVGQFYLKNGDQYLAGTTDNKLCSAEKDERALWVFETDNGSLFIKSVNCAYNSKPQYLEYYASKDVFAMYGMGNVDLYNMDVYKIDAVEPEPEPEPEPQPEDFDYSLVADKGYESEFETDAQGNILVNLTLSDLGDIFLKNMDFIINWDPAQLTYKDYFTSDIKYINTLGKTVIAAMEVNTPVPGEFRYAMANGGKGWVDDENNVVVTLVFAVNPEVADGTKIDLDFTNFVIGFVDDSFAEIDEQAYVAGAIDGYVIKGQAPEPAGDNTELLAEIAAKTEAYVTDVNVSTDGKEIAANEKWLTAEQLAANEAIIAAAQAVADDNTAPQSVIDAALAALRAGQFVAPKAGLAGDKTALQAKYDELKAIMDAVTVADETGNLPDGTKYLGSEDATANNALLEAAKAVLDAPATQAELNAALQALKAFVQPSTVDVNTKELEKFINAAQDMLDEEDALDEKEKGILDEEFETAVQELIDAAEALLESETKTQDQVDEAAARLQLAVSINNAQELLDTLVDENGEPKDEEDAEKVTQLEELIAQGEEIFNGDVELEEIQELIQDMTNIGVKTGEPITVIVFAGIALLAVIGLAYTAKRRFNH